MELKGFYIKEFEARGENVTNSRVTFEKGFNAVMGQSDTGKSTLFKLIDFVLGKSRNQIDLPPQGEGFDTFLLEIHTYDEVVYTAQRKFGDSFTLVKECELEDFDATDKGTQYATSWGASVSLSDFLLSLSGVVVYRCHWD